MATEHNSREGSLQLPDIIAENPQTPKGKQSRQLIRWRVPGLGFVDMYINPQQMDISEKKVIQKQRTKGGYIIQYWGEELTTIRIQGTTGASGIEGINILRKVYRAEQDSFQQVAQMLADRVNAFSVGGNLASLIANGASQSGGNFASNITGGLVIGLLGGNSSPATLPTLGSLAVSVEMYYQGWVFKGFFESFDINESVSNGPGVFNYTLSFTVLDRRGERLNIMSYNRSPAILDPDSGKPKSYYKSDAKTTPMSFGGTKE
jgi:hypothetical protein